MKIIGNPEKLRKIIQEAQSRGKSIGFVPTMGALHEGHLSLIRASRRENDVTIVSIFVNPTQFGPKEDLAEYPRPLRKDLNFLRTEKVDIVFTPPVQTMYPEGLHKPLAIKGAKWPRLSRGLCGRFRPGHFQGVVTAVAKLLRITGPCRLYLGAKDYQQTAVIRQLIEDLDLNVRARVMPTVREKDGLAMSSRNRYLSSGERRRALAISKALFGLRQDLMKKKGTVASLRAKALRKLKKNVDRVQYLEIVDPVTLAPVKKYRKKMVSLAACFVGKTRLIDNVIIPPLQIP
jgi:pantoate--beta-alanine ligase